ncbi:MAG: hypothetical protein IJJ55_05275 [Clostridia bacterium]|nr:hypothetical protein [Clostridia bacterium]
MYIVNIGISREEKSDSEKTAAFESCHNPSFQKTSEICDIRSEVTYKNNKEKNTIKKRWSLFVRYCTDKVKNRQSSEIITPPTAVAKFIRSTLLIIPYLQSDSVVCQELA